MPRKGDSPQKRQDALIALALARRSGGGGLSGSLLIFPSIAALEAFNVSTPTVTRPGSIAVVTSNGSVWALGTGTEGDVDNITIASVTGGTSLQRWFRSNTNAFLPFYLAQTAWFVSSAGNDEAAGTDSGHPLKTNAELYRRWGNTWTPNLKGSGIVTVTHLTASTDGSDPTFYAPNMEAGATFKQVAPRPAPAFTGTLLAVTPKSHAGNNALESTFTTATGAIAAGMVLVNVTRGGSRAKAVLNLGGGNWLLTQPLTPYAGGFPSATLVDTWANGDTIQGFNMVAVDIARIGAHAATLSGAFDPSHLVEDITVVDGNNNFGTLIIDSDFAALEDVESQRTAANDSAPIMISENVGFPTSTQGTSLGGSWTYTGGYIGAPSIQSNLTTNAGGSQLLIETICIGTVGVDNAPTGSAYVHTASGLLTSGACRMFGAGSSIYGPGLLNVLAGSFNLEAATGTAGLPIAILQLVGQTTAYSRATVAGVTTMHGGIGLTGPNLDGPAGNTGFGGYAEGAGATITLAGVQP